MNKAARCWNPEIFRLLFENDIGIHANPIAAAVELNFADVDEKSEEEKLETVKMLSKIPEFTTAVKVRFVDHIWMKFHH